MNKAKRDDKLLNVALLESLNRDREKYKILLKENTELKAEIEKKIMDNNELTVDNVQLKNLIKQSLILYEECEKFAATNKMPMRFINLMESIDIKSKIESI